jgi:hypothetical protein
MIKRKKLLPFLQSGENKMIFRLINIYLIIGMGSLIITIMYLLSHLDLLDRVIYFCIPGFVLGISSGVIYYIGYQSIITKKTKRDTYMLIGRTL